MKMILSSFFLWTEGLPTAGRFVYCVFMGALGAYSFQVAYLTVRMDRTRFRPRVRVLVPLAALFAGILFWSLWLVGAP